MINDIKFKFDEKFKNFDQMSFENQYHKLFERRISD
jgi:hypothetical protein